MILVGNQRGGGKNLALHLMKDENERVQVHQIRGFASDDLQGAFQESYAMSRATRCKQHLFSMSLNPPNEADLTPQDYEAVVDRAEQSLGLTGQPRAIVLHTKNGRSHAHAVWCRVDAAHMKAVQLSFTKRKMQDLSRELYREHGWTMPRGFERTEFRDPRNYSLAEWQQAKRAEKDPAKLKMMFQDAWAMSDSKGAFENALQERGFHLARGDRRGHVAVDYKGEVYPISRWTGVKAKAVRDRLGGIEDLQSVDEAQQRAKDVIAKRLEQLEREQARQAKVRSERLARKKADQKRAHDAHQQKIKREQEQRQQREQAARDARIRKGLKGLLDRVTGRRKKTLEQNAQEARAVQERDQAERQVISKAQETSRRQVESQALKIRETFKATQTKLQVDRAALAAKKQHEAKRDNNVKQSQREAAQRPKRRRARDGSAPER